MNNKDITLVNFVLPKEKRACFPNGCFWLIASLESRNFTVDFRDCQFIRKKKYNLKDIASFFKNSSDIIGISCFSNVLPFVIKIAQEIKKDSPQKTIILGGIGPTLGAKAILDNFSCVDIIVLDKGEETLPELIARLKKGRGQLDSINGIAFRKDSTAYFTPKREDSSTMQKNLIPAFKKFPLSHYKQVSILLAESCPYKCPFCCVPRYYKVRKERNLDLIKEEILYLSQQKDCPRIFYLQDEAFLADKARVYNFLDFLGKTKFKNKIKFGCYGRIDLINDEQILKDLAKNNFFGIFYGIESGSNSILRKIRKGFTIERAREVLLASKRYFKTVIASFIYGYPFESRSEFLDTVLYAGHLFSRGIIAQIHLLCPLPETEFYKSYLKDLTFSEDIISDMSSSQVNIKTIKGMLIKYPGVFSSFYHYKSPCLEYKYNLLKKYSSLT